MEPNEDIEQRFKSLLHRYMSEELAEQLFNSIDTDEMKEMHEAAMKEYEKTLVYHLNNVKDRETFIEFVRALIKDREETVAREQQAPESQRGYGAFGWQNDTIEAYFTAALACVEAHKNRDDILKEPSWRAFAEFLYLGKIYE